MIIPLITIEDIHEVTLPYHANHLHLFFDSEYQKSKGISPKELIKSDMRMKPDHILLTELRGDETWNYFEALNTGHNGSITSTHANDVSSTLARLTGLVMQLENRQLFLICFNLYHKQVIQYRS